MSLFSGGLLSGDIWSTGAFSFESPLKDLLDSGDYTLEQLLAEDELLQELRGVHPKLIEFLSTETAVTQLVHYVVDPKPISMGMGMGGRAAQQAGVEKSENESSPDAAPAANTTAVTPKDPSTWLQEKGKTDDPEMRYIRYPFMACEIFCCEIDGIVNLLVDGHVQQHGGENGAAITSDEEPRPQRILDLLFSLLSDTPVGALDDYRAGYFEKLLRVLFKKRPAAMSEYLRDNKERLIPALLQHLYCHSVMQIVQRLLMPHKPTPKKNNGRQEAALPADDNDEALLTPSEDGEDEVPDANSELRCEWSSSEQALDLLLDSLIGGPLPSVDGEEEEAEINFSSSETEQEQQFDLSLNASEVLITIVQNSMLSSPQMLQLTSTPVLERLILAATTCRPERSVFLPRESLLTSAMCVLESLILQLGGYGAVGIMSLVEETTEQVEEEKKGEAESGLDDDMTSSSSQLAANGDGHQLISNLLNLIELLPLLLDNLSDLLTHPSNSDWKSPSQFNKEPQPMLGSSRLRIVRILEALVLLGDPEVDQKLVQSDCLEICLNFFWEFQWCSMLHQSVANLLVHVFEGGNARVDMQEYFLIRCNILVRLMGSFQENTHDDHDHSPEESPEVVVNINDVAFVADETGQVGGDNDPLPISEDVVDAAIEQEDNKNDVSIAGQSSIPLEDVSQISTEAVQFESRGGSTVGPVSPAQAFRFGYMGHVIIICQALVHACTQSYLDDDDQTGQSEDGTRSIRSTDRLAGIKRSTSSVASRNTNDSVSVSKCDDESVEKEPLFLAEMVRYHPLSDHWNEFVNTILASETSVQSTPLGGHNASGGDSRRPGLADDGDTGFDGQPALPSRRLGELDMDDNDLDVAANMMAALDMGRGSAVDDDDDFSGSGDSNRSYNSGETNNSGGYFFDDPLGKDTTGLGIELGKLTKLKSELDTSFDVRTSLSECDGSSSSSSDEEDNREGDDDIEAPVMDLFAGNFSYEHPHSPSPSAEVGNFDFANFDDAFAGGEAGDDEFGAFIEATPNSSEEQDDIFEVGSRIQSLKLEDDDGQKGEPKLLSSSDQSTIDSTKDDACRDVDPAQITPYPASSSPDNAVSEPTADGRHVVDQTNCVIDPSDKIESDDIGGQMETTDKAIAEDDSSQK